MSRLKSPEREGDAALAVTFMVGLVVLSAAGALSPAHAAGLNVQNPPINRPGRA